MPDTNGLDCGIHVHFAEKANRQRQNEGQWLPAPGQKLRQTAKGQEGNSGVMEMFSVVMLSINLLNIVNGHLPQVCSVAHKLYFNKAFLTAHKIKN